LKENLLKLVDADTAAFNGIMLAFGMSKATVEEKTARKAAIQSATKQAIEIPLSVMKESAASFDVIRQMVLEGNPNSVSDAGVAALCARTAVMGAYMNVRINASSLDDKNLVEKVIAEGKEIERRAMQSEAEILELVNQKIAI
jgi:glutamate formiminotransferase/formiminotetrahydrofolate cyclodeaminase